jgi:hypothetical protein
MSNVLMGLVIDGFKRIDGHMYGSQFSFKLNFNITIVFIFYLFLFSVRLYVMEGTKKTFLNVFQWIIRSNELLIINCAVISLDHKYIDHVIFNHA